MHNFWGNSKDFLTEVESNFGAWRVASLRPSSSSRRTAHMHSSRQHRSVFVLPLQRASLRVLVVSDFAMSVDTKPVVDREQVQPRGRRAVRHGR